MPVGGSFFDILLSHLDRWCHGTSPVENLTNNQFHSNFLLQNTLLDPPPVPPNDNTKLL